MFAYSSLPSTIGLYNKRLRLFWSPENLSFSSKDCIGLSGVERGQALKAVGTARIFDVALVKNGDIDRVTNLLFDEWVREQFGTFRRYRLCDACGDLVGILRYADKSPPPYLFYSEQIDDPTSEISAAITDYDITIMQFPNPFFTKSCSNNFRENERFLRWIGIASKKDAAILILHGFRAISTAAIAERIPMAYRNTDPTNP